jgi:hypothetical protein
MAAIPNNRRISHNWLDWLQTLGIPKIRGAYVWSAERGFRFGTVRSAFYRCRNRPADNRGFDLLSALKHNDCREKPHKGDAADQKQPIRGIEPKQAVVFSNITHTGITYAALLAFLAQTD